MSQRREFMSLAKSEEVRFAELCRRFGISRKTGYKWRDRYRDEGEQGFADRPRRPRRSPSKTPPGMERRVLEVRQAYPWGGRKIRRVLVRRGYSGVPAASTITEILRRHGKLEPEESAKRRPFRRFEYERPNDLWQMDFKGHFPLENGRCHPLTVLDDHSRYAIGLQACRDEKGRTVCERLRCMFRRYGLPERMLMDNGSPWGHDAEHPYTPLTVWLIRLQVHVIHGRPFHPQTQGKDERFHRTLGLEVISRQRFRDCKHCQRRFDVYRVDYNFERPHEALALDVPASRYLPSPRPYPDRLPPVEYGPDDIIRKVYQPGQISYRNRVFGIPKAFIGQHVALRPTTKDGVFRVYFCQMCIGELDTRVSRRGRRQAGALIASARYARSGDQRPE